MDKVDCVVIGAGVIGLAVARRLALAGREVVVLEAAEGIGTVTSSRNSEVIHAGIYYPAGSWMARMCVSGKVALYRHCDEHGIPYRNCGKLIVATTPEETAKLQAIRAHAEANGVADMQTLSGPAARGPRFRAWFIRCRSPADLVCTSRWTSPVRPASGPTSNGSIISTMQSTPCARRASIRRSANTGRRCLTAR